MSHNTFKQVKNLKVDESGIYHEHTKETDHMQDAQFFQIKQGMWFEFEPANYLETNLMEMLEKE